jgi:hypothetical protein
MRKLPSMKSSLTMSLWSLRGRNTNTWTLHQPWRAHTVVETRSRRNSSHALPNWHLRWLQDALQDRGSWPLIMGRSLKDIHSARNKKKFQKISYFTCRRNSTERQTSRRTP